MQVNPEPQDTARAAGSADFTHYGDYLGYAEDLGYEGRVAAEEPSPAADEPTESAEHAGPSATQDGRHSGPPSPRAAADTATSADETGPRPQHAVASV